MLTIRPEQMDALKAKRVQDFEDRLLGTLKRLQPECLRDSSETEVRRFITSSINKALGMNIIHEFWVARFVLATSRMGISGSEQSRIDELLAQFRANAPQLSEEEMVVAIERGLL